MLEESARLLYREWFVRLRFPGHEHTRIVKGVPEGWKKCHIGDFVEKGMVDIQTGPFGTQLKASYYTEEGTPVINVRNIGYGDLRPDKLEYVPEDIADRLSVHLLCEGDIVFGRKGAVDRHILISNSQNGWMQGSDCIRLSSLSDEGAGGAPESITPYRDRLVEIAEDAEREVILVNLRREDVSSSIGYGTRRPCSLGHQRSIGGPL
jgi:hypothetical protein